MKKGEIVQLGVKHKRYWHSNLRLTGVLLAIWFAATFGVSWFARELQALTFMGFPLPFFMAAQGALLIYVVLVGIYAWRMDKLDREFGVQEDQ